MVGGGWWLLGDGWIKKLIPIASRLLVKVMPPIKNPNLPLWLRTLNRFEALIGALNIALSPLKSLPFYFASLSPLFSSFFLHFPEIRVLNHRHCLYS